MLAIVLHARQLAAQPAVAASGVHAIEELAVQAQRDVREALGCLPRAAGAAAPPRLSDQVLGLGTDLPGIDLTVGLDNVGVEPALPSSTRHAAIRIVQEGVSNAVKHSGGRVDVRVSFGELLEMSITSSGRRALPGSLVLGSQHLGSTLPGSGQGLPNMRRRAAELGGTLDFRELPGGGARVTVALPGTPGVRPLPQPLAAPAAQPSAVQLSAVQPPAVELSECA